MILTAVILIVLAISLVATLITKSIFDGIRADIDAAAPMISETIDGDLEILKILRIIK